MTLGDLRDTLISDGCNKPDQVEMLLTATIEGGINNGCEIVKTVSSLGYNTQYVGLLLGKNAGANAEHYQWYRDSDGRYQLHP